MDSKKQPDYVPKRGIGFYFAILFLFFLFVVIPSLHLISFISKWFNNGFEYATKEAVGGYYAFKILLAVAFVAAIPFLRKRGFDRLATAMSIIVLLAAGFLALILFGAIFGGSSTSGDCEVTNGGYYCR